MLLRESPDIMPGMRFMLNSVYIPKGKYKSREASPGEPLQLIWKCYGISKTFSWCTLVSNYKDLQAGHLIKCFTMDLKLVSLPQIFQAKRDDLPNL